MVMTRVLTHRVRYHEADAQGFLFNGRYFEIVDVAMAEFFRDLGFPYGQMVASGMDPSVVSVKMGFRRPAYFDDVLTVDVEVSAVGTSSFHLDMVILRDDEAIADARLVYVNVDPRTAAARPIPPAIAAVLRRQAATTIGVLPDGRTDVQNLTNVDEAGT